MTEARLQEIKERVEQYPMLRDCVEEIEENKKIIEHLHINIITLQSSIDQLNMKIINLGVEIVELKDRLA